MSQPQDAGQVTGNFSPPGGDGQARSGETIDHVPSAKTDTPQPLPGGTIDLPPEAAAQPSATVDIAPGSEQDLGFMTEGNLQIGGTMVRADEKPQPAAIERPTVPGYEILGELGRGGMGVVYKARQIKLNRIVALKMVLAGAHAGTEQLARFYTEAQAVAHLQHPNIVQIYEVSEQAGLPYFSLEFVDGGSLAQEAAGKPQPVDKAAGMVKLLAEAMHHAHQHGVVHRDLKPANVLLTAEGVPKITDFGLAKRLEGESSSQTRSGAILGTPSYMAPEQAMGEVHQVGPLTDVYSLGAILYELLTGRPPFAGPTPMDTVVQVTRDEPVAPSQLQPKVPRDLETICLKCLQKEQPKRYANAGELADDLYRFLAGEPIKARPVSAPERLWRWCRRNPKLAVLSATVLILLVAVAIGSSAAAVTIARERDQKEEQRQAAEKAKTAAQLAEQKAKRNFDDAQHQAQLAVSAIYDVVTKIDTKVREQPGEGMQQLRLDVLDDTRERMDSILESAKGSATFNRTAAALEQHAGDVYKELGRTEEAVEHYEKCRETIEAMAAEDPNNDANIFNLAVVYEKLGSVTLELEDLAVAREHHRKSLDLRIRLTQLTITDPRLTPEKVKESLAGAYLTQAGLASALGDPAGAWEFLSRYLEIQEAVRYSIPREFLSAIEAGSQAKQYPVGFQLKVGEIAFHSNDLETCRALYDRALKRSQAAIQKNPNNAAAQRAMASSCGALGDFHLQLAEPTAALPYYNQSRELMVKLAAGDPDNTATRRGLSFSHYRVATAFLLAGDAVEAQKHYQTCLELRNDIAAFDPRNAHKQIDLMIALARCGEHAEAAQVASKLGSRASDDPSVLFQIACGYALCVPAVASGKAKTDLSLEDRATQQGYAAAAIEAIRQAVAVGYKDFVALEHDPDLLPVRGQAEFQAIVAELRRRQ